MHGTLAVAAAHDRHLGLLPVAHRSLWEFNHWSRCIALFNKWLSQPIKEEHKDPLWATAGILVILTFSSICATSLEEAWPLKTPDSADLEWLRLGAGKMALWHIVAPLRPGSVFSVISEPLASLRKPLPTQGADGLLLEVKQLCAIDDESTQLNNAYFTVAHAVSGFVNSSTDYTLQHQAFDAMAHMDSQFRCLLEKKDAVALVLLSLWYTKAGKSKWWMEQRSKYELAAMKTYLRRHHRTNSVIEALITG
jgi:hypothetical protein